ncbi:MAG TPA: creatininase family protein [Kofleriaceae bacterium]|nr:creatininase family protein [Kofleriaceae bacterium]
MRGDGGKALGAWACDELAAAAGPVCVLVPVGSLEPHGPHLGLGTDTAISEACCERAAILLEDAGLSAAIAPAIAYGVTDCARGFAGAVSIPAAVLSAFVRAVVAGFLASGVDHVALVNNHLEPAHDGAVRAAVSDLSRAKVSVSCPLSRRWARTLDAEFRSGACHGGAYETSMVMACAPDLVDDRIRQTLPEVAVSLSDRLSAGDTDFRAMGLARAYAGNPAAATAAAGHDLLDRLARMVVTEVTEALAKAAV